MRELHNIGKKALASINHHEATTYVNYYFQKESSPILTYSIGFGLLFPLAALGIVFHYRRYIFLMPVVASFLTMLLFFYMARLRMPMVPFMAIFAGGALSTLLSHIKNRRWNKVILSCIFLIVVYLLSNLNLVPVDTSNEWNKMGVVLRVQKRYFEAERAFNRAMI